MFNFAQKELYPQKHWLCNFLNSSCQHGQASFAAETRDAIITTSIISTSDRVLFFFFFLVSRFQNIFKDDPVYRMERAIRVGRRGRGALPPVAGRAGLPAFSPSWDVDRTTGILAQKVNANRLFPLRRGQLEGVMQGAPLISRLAGLQALAGDPSALTGTLPVCYHITRLIPLTVGQRRLREARGGFPPFPLGSSVIPQASDPQGGDKGRGTASATPEPGEDWRRALNSPGIWERHRDNDSVLERALCWRHKRKGKR